MCTSHLIRVDAGRLQPVLVQRSSRTLHLAVDEAVEDAHAAESKHKVDAHEDGGVRSASHAVKAAGADKWHQDKNIPERGKAGHPHNPAAHQCQHDPLSTENLGKELRVGNEEVAS